MLIKKLLVAVFICFSQFLHAQDKFLPETTLGIKQGLNMSRLVITPDTSPGFLFGYNGGLVFRHISEPHLGIQIELNFSQKGWSQRLDSANSYSRRSSYVELPFLSHFEMGKVNSGTNFTLDVGTVLSCLISEKEKIGIVDTGRMKKYYGNKIGNKLDFSICIGIGIVRKTSLGNFEIGCRIVQSLTDIFKINTNYDLTSSKNQVISFDLKYFVNLSKK